MEKEPKHTIALGTKWQRAKTTKAQREGKLKSLLNALNRDKSLNESFLELRLSGEVFELKSCKTPINPETFNPLVADFLAAYSVISEMFSDRTESQREFYLEFNLDQTITPEPLKLIAEIFAPSLLLLFGNGRGDPITLSVGSLRISLPDSLNDEMLNRLIPILSGTLPKVASSVLSGADVRHLIRHPELLTEGSSPATIFIPQTRLDGSPVLDKGRMTRNDGSN